MSKSIKPYEEVQTVLLACLLKNSTMPEPAIYEDTIVLTTIRMTWPLAKLVDITANIGRIAST